MRKALWPRCCCWRALARRKAGATSRTESPYPDSDATPAPTPDQGVIQLDRAMEHVRALGVGDGYRQAGTEGDRTAASYITREIEELGRDRPSRSSLCRREVNPRTSSAARRVSTNVLPI